MADDWDRFNLEKAIDYSVEAIKASMLLNGGAAIALMTLVGAVSGKTELAVDLNVSQVKAALAYFGKGLGVGVLTFVAAYLSQIFFFHHNQSGRLWLGIA